MNNLPIVKEFMELVQIDAASRNEREIADVVIGKLKEIGCSVCEDDAGEKIGGNTGNIFAVLEGDCEGSVLFSAHLDRVANGIGIKPRIEGKRIVSDGTILSADDVSGISAILDGLRRIVASGKPHPRIEVLFTVCEEKGVSGSKYVDYSKIKSKMAFVLDSPGRIGRVINAAPSKASLSFEVFGKNAHAGNAPEQGINSVVTAAKILSRIKDGRIDELTTANWAAVEASSPTNVVNAYAKVYGEARSGDHKRLEDYIAQFEDICSVVASETGAKIAPSAVVDYKGFLIPIENPTIKIMGEVFKKMDIKMAVERGGGGMDANRLNANGIESVGVATGYALNHSKNEYIELEDLIRAGEMVENIICAFNTGK